jgi:hypothetical protein
MEYIANTQGFFTLNATEVCHKTFGSLSKLKKKKKISGDGKRKNY